MHFSNCGVYGPFPICLIIGFPKLVNSHVRENSLWNSWLLDIGEQKNITAIAENNTSLRHAFSFDGSHNMRSSQSRVYVTNYIRPILFRQVPRLGNGFLNLWFPPLWKFTENSGFNQNKFFFAPVCSELKNKMGVCRPPWWNDNFRSIHYLLIAW